MIMQNKILDIISEIQSEKKDKNIYPDHTLDKEVKDRMLGMGYSSELVYKEINRLEYNKLIKTGETINYRFIKRV